jgi:predicted SAM-dependent methyltransferase
MLGAPNHSRMWAKNGGGGSTVQQTCILAICLIVGTSVFNRYFLTSKYEISSSPLARMSNLNVVQTQGLQLAQSTIGSQIEQYCKQQHEFADLKIAQRPVLIYVGSSGIRQPGFVSYPFDELDITQPAHFQRIICRDSVDTFFSEHTLEHIPLNQYSTIFGLFLQYLKPGGFVRIAIPTYSDLHRPSEVDKRYGHVGIVSAPVLEREMQSAGFTNVTILEQVHFTNGQRKGFTSKLWDECEGRVRRSFRHDQRNAQYLKERYAAFAMVGNNDINDVINSTDFPSVLSTIVQGHRPYISGRSIA